MRTTLSARAHAFARSGGKRRESTRRLPKIKLRTSQHPEVYHLSSIHRMVHNNRLTLESLPTTLQTVKRITFCWHVLTAYLLSSLTA